MNDKRVQKPLSCKILILLQFILGIGALFGGAGLILSPDGSLMKMPVTLLQHSPFHSFLIPGIILFVVFGILPIVIAIYLVKPSRCYHYNWLNIFQDHYSCWTYSLYLGFGLIIWLIVQIYYIQAIAMIHLLYFSLGLLIQIITLLPSVQHYYLKN